MIANEDGCAVIERSGGCQKSGDYKMIWISGHLAALRGPGHHRRK
jgi:hypothetical protein